MISDEQLDQYRVDSTKIRIVRDALEQNDVVGIVVAWDDTHMLIRRPNRRVVKVKRDYLLQEANEPRINPFID